MRVSEKHLVALTGQLTNDADDSLRGFYALKELGEEAAVEPIPILFSSALYELVQHRLGAEPTRGDVVRLVGELRCEPKLGRQVEDIDPRTAEAMIGAMLGFPGAHAELKAVPPLTHSVTQVAMLRALGIQAELAGPRLEAFLQAARTRADDLIDAGFRPDLGPSMAVL